MTVREPPTIDQFNLSIGSDRIRLATTDPPRALGPPLLLLNGLGDRAALLEPLMRQLPRFRVVAFDLPGVGQSQPSTRPRRIAGYANLVRETLDALHVERANVMGIGWGGALAQEFVHRHAERVVRLVLAATTTGRLTVPRTVSAWLYALAPRPISAAWVRRHAGALYGGDFRRDPALWAHLSPCPSPPTVSGNLEQVFALAGWSSTEWLRTIRRPTLVLAGEDDPLAPGAEARAMAAAIPNAELEIFDCGHLFVLTRLDRVVASIERFLIQSVPYSPERDHG